MTAEIIRLPVGPVKAPTRRVGSIHKAGTERDVLKRTEAAQSIIELMISLGVTLELLAAVASGRQR
jgi:hypothetical protein